MSARSIVHDERADQLARYVDAFVAARCLAADEALTPTADLYREYGAWATGAWERKRARWEEEGLGELDDADAPWPVARNAFGQALRDNGIAISRQWVDDRSRCVACAHGIVLLPA